MSRTLVLPFGRCMDPFLDSGMMAAGSSGGKLSPLRSDYSKPRRPYEEVTVTPSMLSTSALSILIVIDSISCNSG